MTPHPATPPPHHTLPAAPGSDIATRWLLAAGLGSLLLR